MDVLLDTNIILEHLRSAILKNIPPHVDFFTSVIVEAELLRFRGLSPFEIMAIEKFLSFTTIVPVTSDIGRKAAALGRTRKTKLPDLLIAATAIQHNLVLATKNISDFKGIPGLIIKNTLSI